jgi:hypothetical protein
LLNTLKQLAPKPPIFFDFLWLQHLVRGPQRKGLLNGHLQRQLLVDWQQGRLQLLQNLQDALIESQPAMRKKGRQEVLYGV